MYAKNDLAYFSFIVFQISGKYRPYRMKQFCRSAIAMRCILSRKYKPNSIETLWLSVWYGK